MRLTLSGALVLVFTHAAWAREACVLFPAVHKPPATNFLVDRETTYRCVCGVNVGRVLPSGLCAPDRRAPF